MPENMSCSWAYLSTLSDSADSKLRLTMDPCTTRVGIRCAQGILDSQIIDVVAALLNHHPVTRKGTSF